MKARPILFSGPMIRALLSGAKTQTRRVVKLQPEDVFAHEVASYSQATGATVHYPKDATATVFSDGLWYSLGPSAAGPIACPYGQPGDVLWVRETWSRAKLYPASHEMFYRADGDVLGRQLSLSYVEREKCWRPSIHMPRWASRLTLRITDVRVERVQEISEDDAIAEGVDTITMADVARQAAWSRRQDFSRLWDSINGQRAGCSWADNPWCWCLTFDVIQQNVDELT